ncbi:MAG: DinB family protein [Anaerolineales bacterium]|jgi:uncharacterized damage-inducible protein DinB
MKFAEAVDHFSKVTQYLSEDDLEREWEWGEYDEGLRFTFFRVYEELRTLAARLGTARIGSERPLSTTQRILAQYHAAYRDLRAVLIGIRVAEGGRQPAEGEWSLKEVLAHIIGAERAFFAVTLDALQRERSADGRPMEMTDEAWDAFWEGDPFDQLKKEGELSSILAYYDDLHWRVLRAFDDITDDELSIGAVFWESDPMTVEFRLHRFDAHLRQHTIQAEKTLELLDLRPSEAKRLLRHIHAALAEVEGITIGYEDLGADERQRVADEIVGYADEVARVISG